MKQQEALVKFVNLREKNFFLQNLLPGRTRLKSDSHLPKKIILFALMIALQKWWKILILILILSFSR